MWYGVTLAIGIIILIISIIMLRQSVQFIKAGRKTTATVSEMITVSGSDGNTYKPVFTYKTDNGQEYTYKHNASSSPPAWSVGEQATLIYDTADPNKAKLLTYFGAFAWSIVLMAIAMPLIVVGGGYFWAMSFFKQLSL